MRASMLILLALSLAGCMAVDKPLYDDAKEDTYYMSKLEGAWQAIFPGDADNPMHLVVSNNGAQGYSIRENRDFEPRSKHYSPDMVAYLVKFGGYNFLDLTILPAENSEADPDLLALAGYHFPARVKEIVFDDETGEANIVLLVPSQEDWMLSYINRHPELNITHESKAMAGDETDKLVFSGAREDLRQFLVACAESVKGFDTELPFLLKPEVGPEEAQAEEAETAQESS